MSDTTGTRLAERSLLRVAGDDARGFLQGLLTANLAGPESPMPVWAGLLTPQGKALFDMLLWSDGEGAILIDVERSQAEALAKRLAIYRLRRAITIEPAAGAVHWAIDGDRGVADPRLGVLGRRWLVPDDRGDAADAAWRRHRLSLGVTEGIGELGSGETLWLEANARELNGVDFAKGCYVGQENTARMHYRGKVNRRLVVAPIGEPGDRTRAIYPDDARMVELRRIDALGDALVPAWLAAALADQRPTAV